MGPKAKNKTWIRRGVLFALVGGFVALIAIAARPRPVPVESEPVTRGSLRVSIDEDGQTRVKDRYVISAPIMGNLMRIDHAVGDMIEVDAPVAIMLPVRSGLIDARTRAVSDARVSAAQASVQLSRATTRSAEAALEHATSEVARLRPLVSSGAVAQQMLDNAEYTERSAREALSSAQFGGRVAAHELRMARASVATSDPRGDQTQLPINSPVAGRVLRVFRESEGVVQPGEPLIEIGNPEALEVVADVLTTEAVRIEPGDPVRIVRWGGEDALEGRVRLVEPSAFTTRSALGVQEQRVNVIVDLVSGRDAWARLGDGYRVEAEIVVDEVEDALLVPASALFRRGDSFAVYAIRQDVARLVEVELVARDPDQVAVAGELQEGERVVVHPPDTVTDGADVEVLAVTE